MSAFVTGAIAFLVQLTLSDRAAKGRDVLIYAIPEPNTFFFPQFFLHRVRRRKVFLIIIRTIIIAAWMFSVGKQLQTQQVHPSLYLPPQLTQRLRSYLDSSLPKARTLP